MFTLPTIQIGGHKYKVTLTEAYSVSSDEMRIGDHCPVTLEVRVATQTADGGKRELSVLEATYLHEILHAVDAVYDCELTEDNIEPLAEGLYQVLKQFGLKMITDD
jgi:hypothetical protein